MNGELQLERLMELMRRLRLIRSIEQLASVLEHAAKREISYSDFLEELLSGELADKQDRNTTMRIRATLMPARRWAGMAG